MIPLRRILCLTDSPEPWCPALELSAALARRGGGTVRSLRATESSWLSGGHGISMAVAVAPGGELLAAVLREARSWPADLVVLSLCGLPGTSWKPGAVTEGVLRQSPCPVLVMPRTRIVPVREGFSQIVCPFDFSDLSLQALQHALAFASGPGARVTLLHVVEWFPDETRPHGGALPIAEYCLDLSRALCDRLRAAVPTEARASCEWEEIVATGKPHHRILGLAHEREVDLIVLGVHWRRALDQRLLGATVGHVVREASCPVLAVRASR